MVEVNYIMQCVLLRENKIDQEKEHFRIICMNKAGYILNIDLIALCTAKSMPAEPMNIYRVVVIKNANRVVVICNHLSKRLLPSEVDKDNAFRLIQEGAYIILNITLVDHLIITPIT